MKLKTARRFLSRNTDIMALHSGKIKKAKPSFLRRWKEATSTLLKETI